MEKYYTRACNFYFGKSSLNKVRQKKSIPLNGNKYLSFDSIEIINRKFNKTINISEIQKQNYSLKKKILKDLKTLKKKKYFRGLNLKNSPIIMGILNLTPDSFSDGGKFNKKNKSLKHAKKLIEQGSKIIDIGGESTRPGSKTISEKVEWNRISYILKNRSKLKCFVSLDTRKSKIIEKGINYKIDIINDVSGFTFDNRTLSLLKKNKTPFVINHCQGITETMQKKPKYSNVLLDVYDYFENKINQLRKIGIKHNNIILDPGIGFGKNLKHNITLISKVSIFHSLGFPIMLGLSRKKFIEILSGNNTSKKRLGGTISSNLFALMQGVEILRVHDVNEMKQSIKIFKRLFY